VADRLYVLGGATNTTEIGTVNADGTVESWIFGPSLAAGVSHSAAVSDGRRLYLLGGYVGVPTGTTQVADIQPNGGLSGWRFTTPLTGPREGSAAAIFGGRVYVAGGYTGNIPALNTVVSAPILPNGDLGNWRDEAAMLADRYHPVAFVGSSRLFVGAGTPDYA